MGAENLAYRIKQPIARARQLLDLHRRTFKTFWAWSEGVLNGALLTGRLWTAFGRQIFTGESTNARSLRNFPMQANGAEMLRLACIGLIHRGVAVCAPIHDAVLVEAPLEHLQDAVDLTQRTLREASAAVLGGFELESDVKVVRYPELYRDERGAAMWDLVTEQLGRRIRGGQIVSA
jgi:DNA polymerase I-like protein with 3'-5' exonuclease and polymerase domains